MDRIIILIIGYLIACYIWKKIDCSRFIKIHNAVLFISSIMVIKFRIYDFVRNHHNIIRLSD